MEVPVHLVLDGPYYMWVAMTNIGDGNAGDEIEVPRALRAEQPTSLCTFYGNAERRWRSLCEAMKEYLPVEVYGHSERAQKKAPAETAEAYH